MHPWNEQIMLVVKLLEARFERLRGSLGTGPTPDTRRFAAALLVYARPFLTDQIISSVLRDGVRQHSRGRQEVTAATLARESTVKELAADLLARLQRIQPPDEQADAHWKVVGLLEEAERYPYENNAHLRIALDWITRVYPDTINPAETRVLLASVGRTAHGERAERIRLSLLERAEPWLGAYLVYLYSRCPEAERDLRRNPESWVTSQSVRAWLGEPPPSAATSFTWHERPTDVMDAVTAFHDWAVSQLLAFQVIDRVIDRLCERVTRFEANEYRDSIQSRGAGGNADEFEFRRRMNIYLHDRGLDPLPEVETGNASPDALVIPAIKAYMNVSALPVAVEVKVIRPGDQPADIIARLEDGLEKAKTYARRWSLRTCYLLVFWADNRSYELPDRLSAADETTVLVRVVDLRSSPSTVSKGGRKPLQWRVGAP